MSQICPPSKTQLSTFRLHFSFPVEKITYLMRIYDVLLAIDQSPVWLSLSEQITRNVCLHGGEKWSISLHINKQGCHSHQSFQSSECEFLSPVGAQEEPYLRSGCHHSYWSKELWPWKATAGCWPQIAKMHMKGRISKSRLLHLHIHRTVWTSLTWDNVIFLINNNLLMFRLPAPCCNLLFTLAPPPTSLEQLSQG